MPVGSTFNYQNTNSITAEDFHCFSVKTDIIKNLTII